jgi:transcriptional regulator with XRE-family HTH domain
MAKILGYKNKSGYSQLENGIVKMTIDRAKLIASTLGVSPEDIFFK